MNNNEVTGKEIGVVSIHMYKESTTNKPCFYIKSQNQDVLPLSYIIEDMLKHY